MSVSKPGSEPLVVVHGAATDEEVAAVVVVLHAHAAAASAASPAASAAPRSVWASPHGKVRSAYPSGPGGWRASGLPR